MNPEPYLNFKPQNLILFILLAAIFFYSAGEAFGMRIIDIGERVKFCFSKPDPGFDRLQGFLKAADAVICSISGLKTSDKTALCSVIVTNNDMKDGFEINSSGDVLRIFLSEDLSGWDKNYKAQSAVISAMLLSRFGIKPDSNYGKVPAWMTAGILSKIEMRRNPAMLSGVLVYPGVRGLISGGVQPDLSCVLNNPLEYRDGPAFTLYSETCAIIIDAIARIPKSRDILMAMLKSAVDGEKADKAFKTAINDYIIRSGLDLSTVPVDQISPEKRADIWFGTVIRNSSVNIFFPGSADFVDKRLYELKTVSYTVAVPAGKDKPPKPEVRTCDISELGKKWNEIENPENVANICLKYFSELSNQSPSLIQAEVSKVAELLCNLKNIDKDTFESDFRSAEKKLREKIARLRQVEDYIGECETKFITFRKKYSAELKYLEDSGTFTGQFCPSLNSILDKEEKNF